MCAQTFGVTFGVLRNEEQTGRRRSIRVQLLPTGDGSRPMNQARSSAEECAWAPGCNSRASDFASLVIAVFRLGAEPVTTVEALATRDF